MAFPTPAMPVPLGRAVRPVWWKIIERFPLSAGAANLTGNATRNNYGHIYFTSPPGNSPSINLLAFQQKCSSLGKFFSPPITKTSNPDSRG